MRKRSLCDGASLVLGVFNRWMVRRQDGRHWSILVLDAASLLLSDVDSPNHRAYLVVHSLALRLRDYLLECWTGGRIVCVST